VIAAIGAFDGFHRGHQALLRAASERSAERGEPWGVVTFTRHPDSILGPTGFKSLFTPGEQTIIERYFNIPSVHRIDFTPEVAGMTPVEFLDVISSRFGVTGIVVGEDFRFGRDRGGTPEFLRRECGRRGWSADVVPISLTDDGDPICSTAIRSAVASGDVVRAWELLGYPFFCRGVVARGNGRGRGLGFPTANIEIDRGKTDPPDGVYATAAFCGGQWRPGGANVGWNPTFTDVRSRRFEINLPDYSGDLYGMELPFFIVGRIRDEIRFENPEALTARIAIDSRVVAETVQTTLAGAPGMWRDFARALSA
jgi:riboflavin kinase/FMN adenylyltransferase